MRVKKYKRLLAAVLAVCMMLSLSCPAYAAGGQSSFINWLSGGRNRGGSSGSNRSNEKMTLVEDETTVEDDTELRASTYVLTQSDTPSAQATSSTTLKYFPVTLFDYDTNEINAATRSVDTSNESWWEGLYFNDGSPSKYSNKTYAPYNVWTNKVFNTETKYYSSRSSSNPISLNTYGKLGLYTSDANKQVSNFYPKGSNTTYSSTGGYVYSGLVEDKLDANKGIVFNVPEGGIFDSSDASTKDVYTDVGLPFTFDGTTYTFDAATMSVGFESSASSNVNLKYSSGSSSGFFPFGTSSEAAMYHFGMAATIPFTMTADGTLNGMNGEDIVFNFAGDDDVWVFIDGQLVLDIGGIHNSVNGSINFAENTTTVSATNSTTNSGYMNATDGVVEGKITGQLFNDGTGTGILNQTIETFAATDSHELTIFYLERGKGASNCKIQFNLPMKDTVSVTKRATQSISSDGTVSPLTAAEQAVVDNIDFGFTLTKNGTPVANTNYNLMNANGQVISTPSTDANGHFTLRNGQTARFVGEIVTDGAEYQVVEDAVEAKGFKLPTYTYSGTSAGGFTVSSKSYSTGSGIPSTTQNLTSAAVTAKGSDEAEDSLNFVCENYFDANLPNPSSRPVDDQIVIDYGLPVVIDVLANDVYRGDRIEITDVTGAQYGTATIKNGKITYQLTKQLTGVEVLTYTAKVTGSGNSGTTTTTSSESNTAKVYIIPATSMYYEENFSDLVNFTDSWSNVGTAQTDPQEPGVVGTVGDSPYGSDAAYLNDGGDSNGSSKYVDTTSGSASFSYSFTGTGTSFFARTSGTAAYMRVVIKDEAGNTVSDTRRNNIYKSVADTEVGTLYNIPVFTYEADNYGTYTVTVTLMKANADLDRGKDFYLDGIRVINPLNSSDENASVAKAAYATDGEANMTVATLREKLLNDAAIEEEVTDEDGNTTTQLKWDGENFVIFTDTNGEIKSAEEYKSNGPKEEVYLNNGQSVTFSLKDWDANTNKIYLGVKAPLGSGSVSINGNTLNLSNAADCYYEVSNYADITADEDGVKIATFKVEATSSLVSVTNIKVTGNAEFTIVNQESITADEDSGDEEVAAVAAQSLEDTTDVSDESETTEEPAAPADTEVPTEEPGTAEEPEKTEEPDLSEDADSEAETEPEASPAEEAPAEQNSGANEEA